MRTCSFGLEPALRPIAEGDVLRPGRSSMSGIHRGTVTGLTREVALFDGEVLDLVQLAAEPKGELSRKVVSITTKNVSVERPTAEIRSVSAHLQHS